MTSIPLCFESAFGPDMTEAMGQAFEQACAGQEFSNELKETIASRILQVAKSGERDATRLCAKALSSLGVAA